MRLLFSLLLLLSLPALAQQTKSLVVLRTFTAGDKTLPIFNGASGQLMTGSNLAVPTPDDLTIPGQVNTSSGNVTGALTTGTLSYAFASAQPSYLGVFADGGIVTLDINHNFFVLTNTGPAWSLNVPGSMPDGMVVVKGFNQSSVSPSVVTLSNAAIRPEQDSSITTNTFTLPQSSASVFWVYLSITGGVIDSFSVVGDTFVTTATAASVSFSPFQGITETTVQAGMQGIETRKADLLDLSSVATNGLYSSLSGAPSNMSQSEANAGIGTVGRLLTAAVLHQAITAQGPEVSAQVVRSAGTQAVITNTAALLTFGTTSPSLALTNSGTWRIDSSANLLSVAPSYATTNSVTYKLRRTNNTAADLTAAAFTLTINAQTNSGTVELGQSVLPTYLYSTTLTNDIIELWASSAASIAGLKGEQAWIVATRLGAASADTTAPTFVSANISTDGTVITNVFSEPVTAGAGGFNGFTATLTGGASSQTYVSGAGTTTLLYSLARTVAAGETGTQAYVQGGTGIQDASANLLANFSGTTITNNSTLFAVTAGVFGGTSGDNDSMTSSTLVNWVDGKAFTVNMWPKHQGSNDQAQAYLRNANGRFRIYRGTDNKVKVHGATTGGTTTLEMQSTATLTTTNGYVHVLIAVDLANSANKHIYFNGLDVTDTASITNNNNTMDLSNVSMTFGATSGGIPLFFGTASELILYNSYINDPTLFASGGHPISPPSGSSFYVHGPWTATPVLDNSGNANNFTVTGTITAGTPP